MSSCDVPSAAYRTFPAFVVCFINVVISDMFISFVIIVFATFGDYVESYMKRKVGVKDSGNLIPGHGGILDRMDSIYLSLLPYLVILSLFR